MKKILIVLSVLFSLSLFCCPDKDFHDSMQPLIEQKVVEIKDKKLIAHKKMISVAVVVASKQTGEDPKQLAEQIGRGLALYAKFHELTLEFLD
ncbi:MAG: hypothetical protein LBT51_01985 [Fusobacteriaceae bacterium]|jgi:hypothetical protein|nr:hypothetical protein [Fusobacteriaceae bacterium]